MKEWIAVFSTGTHTDTAGRTREWTEEDLDAIVSSYDPSEHEAPVVIGHPKDDSPAWGWVGGLRRSGGVLYARLRELVPEFVGMLKKSMFKKRSISLYPDGRLRHIGFLGGAPPAVKGLQDISFSAVRDEATLMTYEDTINEEKEVQDVSFLERLKGGGKEKEEARQASFEARVLTGKLLGEGRVTPAAAKAGMGLQSFIEAVSAVETPVRFSEDGEARSQRPVEFLMEFLINLPRAVEYGEAAPAAADIEEPGARREHMITEYMDKNPGVTLRMAVLSVSKEHPELFER